MGVKLKLHGKCDNYAFRSMQFYKDTKLLFWVKHLYYLLEVCNFIKSQNISAKCDNPMFLLDRTFKMVDFAESQSDAIEELALLP